MSNSTARRNAIHKAREEGIYASNNSHRPEESNSYLPRAHWHWGAYKGDSGLAFAFMTGYDYAKNIRKNNRAILST